MSLFTAIDSKFQADSNGAIATKQFLLACREILPIFGKNTAQKYNNNNKYISRHIRTSSVCSSKERHCW